MNDKKERRRNNYSFNKNEEIKEERIESALYGLRRLRIIRGFKGDLHFDGGEFIKADLIVYPNWKGKILLKTVNGFDGRKPKEADEYGVYYLEINDEMTMASIKTTIMEILLTEMEKRGKGNK